MTGFKDEVGPKNAISLYLHIPFCEVKCGYCDFYSVPRGFEDFGLQRDYVEALIREIRERLAPFSGRRVRSVFFGGGTPSLLNPKLLERILLELSEHLPWSPDTEVTLEANPKTVSLEKLRAFRGLGINRLSVGVQSFQDRFLKALGRIHSGAEARRTVEEARKAGFENISCDLIFALPGQSFEDWKDDLEEALSLGTDHLSAYHLTIEKNTPFEALYSQGRLDLPTEEEGIRCLWWTRERLDGARLEAYEISNFSKPGFECVHNQNYWSYGEYVGLGAGAVSFIMGEASGVPPSPPRVREFFAVRRHNVRNLKKYLDGSVLDSLDFEDPIDRRTAMGEFCMLGLRTREGIQASPFKRLFGEALGEAFGSQRARWEERGWVKATPDRWVVTAEGLLFTDEMAASFLP